MQRDTTRICGAVFFGVHFFNPPYVLPLCELIASPYSDKDIYQELKSYLQGTLFRVVAESKDCPAFLGNRIGFYFLNEALQYAEKYKERGGIDYMDAILGSFTGRAMAPLVTADFVGLDVHKAIVDNIFLSTDDYAHDAFVLPPFVGDLISEKKLGRKSGQGLYNVHKEEDGSTRKMVWDINTKQYRDVVDYSFVFAGNMKRHLSRGEYKMALKELVENPSEEADICLRFLLRYIIYSIFIAKQVGYRPEVADDVMAAGFTWCPPFALIDAFSYICDLKSMLKSRIDSEIKSRVDIDELLQDCPRSKYDFRIYFKAR